jgi:hypothetical protein
MNLNSLKPAWQQFRFLNSMPSMEKDEILFIIERAEEMRIYNTHRYLINTLMFTILIISCQGG